MFIPYHSLLLISAMWLTNEMWWRGWVYIPALLDWYHYPLPPPNVEVPWRKPLTDFFPERSNKPNVVLILADDMGFNDLSLFGGHYFGNIKTPNIDSIGKEGFTFRNAYAGHATCAPARASLLTGRYATKVGFEFTPASPTLSWVLGALMGNGRLPGIYHAEDAKYVTDANMTLPRSDLTLAEALQGSGYKSLQLGKWHLGSTKDSKATKRGFDESLGFDIISRYLQYGDRQSVDCRFRDPFDRYLWANVRYEVSKDNGPSFKPKGYLSDYLSKEAARAISVNRDVPFFLFMAFTSMHTPFQALRSDFDIINALEKEIGYSIGQTRMSHCEKVYGAMLIALDRAVGNMLTALEENGLTNNTIVIFTNDNGAPAYLWDMNTPFRGGKASFFEGGIHVPFLLKWPNLSKKYDKYLGREQTSSTDTGSQSNIRRKTNIPSASQSPNLNCLGNKGNNHFCKLQEGKDMGIVIDNMVAHMDIFPTVLEAAGVELSESYTSILDGKSLIPLLKGAVARSADTASDVMMPSNISAMEALTQRGTSGHQDLFWRSGHYMAYRKGNWKIQSALRPNKKWLYNLAIDPGERYNLADVPAYREKLNEMVMEMQRENYSHSEPIWPALSETPCLIDKLFPGHYVRGDEYVYWCN